MDDGVRIGGGHRYTGGVTSWSRGLSALAVVLAMLGLPVASVYCEIACPQASSAAAHASPPSDRIAALPGAGPCHEAPGAAVSAPGQPSATVGLSSMPAHACDHPAVVSSRRANEGLRVPAPVAMSALPATPHLAMHLAPRAVAAEFTRERPPTPRPVGAFSPVLRI